MLPFPDYLPPRPILSEDIRLSVNWLVLHTFDIRPRYNKPPHAGFEHRPMPTNRAAWNSSSAVLMDCMPLP